jgi:hypothetical protein
MIKIDRIFLFGDSFVEGQGTYESVSDRGEYLEADLPFKEIGNWRKQNSWNKFIEERTRCQVFNNAKQGSDNYGQFSQLNVLLETLTPNDLVIFGFTSKLRDSGVSIQYAFNQIHDNKSLLHRENPLGKQIAWQKNLLEIEKYNTNLDGHVQYKNEYEKKFTKEYVEEFFTTILDEQVYETIAQSNYIFYQNWFKKKGLNIIFFDIFEKYIDENFTKPGFNVDNDMYISYESKSLTDVLYEYEDKKIKESDKFRIWEWGMYKPLQVIHANQHGYKIFVDYLFENFLDKRYEFKTNPL